MDPVSKHYGRVRYWPGLHLKDFFTDMAVIPHSVLVCPYFKHMRLLIVKGFVLGDFKLEV